MNQSSSAALRTPTWLLLLGGATVGLALSTVALRYRRYLRGLDTQPPGDGLDDLEATGSGAAERAGRVRLVAWNRFQDKMDERTNAYEIHSKRASDAATATGDLTDVIRMYTTAPLSTGDWLSVHQGILLPGQNSIYGGQPVDATVFAETRKAQRALLQSAGVLECVDTMHLRLPYPRVWESSERSSTPMVLYRRARVIIHACPLTAPDERVSTRAASDSATPP